MEFRLVLLSSLLAALFGVLSYFWIGPIAELRAGPTVLIDSFLRGPDLVIRIDNPSRAPVPEHEFNIHCNGEPCFTKLPDGEWVKREIGRYTLLNRADTNESQISIVSKIPPGEYLQISLRKTVGAPSPALSITADAVGSKPQQLSRRSVVGALLRHHDAILGFAALAAVLLIAAIVVIILRRPQLPIAPSTPATPTAPSSGPPGGPAIAPGAPTAPTIPSEVIPDLSLHASLSPPVEPKHDPAAPPVAAPPVTGPQGSDLGKPAVPRPPAANRPRTD